MSTARIQAQDLFSTDPVAPTVATDSATASESAKEAAAIEKIQQQDVTRPEGPEDAQALNLFKQRPADKLNWYNLMAFLVQSSVKAGVPSRTVILILLLPMLATIIAFIRHVIGLPSIGMLVPVALSITLLSTGITAGLILLGTIIFASTVARILLKKFVLCSFQRWLFLCSLYRYFCSLP
jgi:hypothetical protein